MRKRAASINVQDVQLLQIHLLLLAQKVSLRAVGTLEDQEEGGLVVSQE